MPAMTDPTNGLTSFQQALLAGEVDVQPGEVDPKLIVHMDIPQGDMRFTYARVSNRKIVEAIAIFVRTEPIKGLPTFQVGYAVPPKYRGKGAAKAIVEAGIAELKSGLNRNGVKAFWIEAVVGSENHASRGVAEAVFSKTCKATTDELSGEPAVVYLHKVE